MDSYLLLMFVTVEQEKVLKNLFLEKGWQYSKPDLSIMTNLLGPITSPVIYREDKEISDHVTKKPVEEVTYVDNKPATVVDYQDLNSSIEDKEYVKIPTELGMVTHSEDVQNEHDYMMKETETGIIGPGRLSNKDTSEAMITETKTNHDKRVQRSKRKRKLGKEVEDELRERSTKTVNSDHSMSSLIETNVVVGKSMDMERVCEVTDSKTDGDGKVMKKVEKHTRQSDRFIPCPICGKLVSAKNILRHSKSHQNLPYKCGACSLYFGTQEKKDNHDKIKHNGLQYVCSVCGVRYKFINSLKEHMALKHENAKLQYTCTICGKGFSRIGQREDHMNTHANSTPYECPFCGRTYNNKSSFNRHTHSCSTRTHCKCSECGHDFKSELRLRNHMNRVHGKDVFTCKCGKVFKTQVDKGKHAVFCVSQKNETEFSPCNETVKVMLCDQKERMKDGDELNGTVKTIEILEEGVDESYITDGRVIHVQILDCQTMDYSIVNTDSTNSS